MKKIIKTAALCCIGIFLFKGNANAQVVSDTFRFSNTIARFVVPNGVTSITIEAIGAQGGDGSTPSTNPGGHGADLMGTFSVTPGNVLNILVGQKPGPVSGSGANAGGGGSFVWDSTNSNTLFMAAGAGGGSCTYGLNPPNGKDADLADSGTMGTYDNASYADTSTAPGGRSGNGGNAWFEGSGGAGWLSNGANGNGYCSQTYGGLTPLNGGQGGIGTAANGGFGGGGGAGRCWWSAGGGGGYSGGSGSGGTEGGGGGGGSFNGGTSQTNVVSADTGSGLVVITYSTPNGIKNITDAAKVSVYPSPTTGNFTISNLSKGDIVRIYDYLGTEISTEVVGNTGNLSYDISDKASGIYLVKIQTADGFLIVQKHIVKAQ